MWFLCRKFLNPLNCSIPPSMPRTIKFCHLFLCWNRLHWSGKHFLEGKNRLWDIKLLPLLTFDFCTLDRWLPGSRDETWGGGTELLGVSTKKTSTAGSTNPAPVMCYSAVKKCSPDCGCLIQLSCFFSPPFDYKLAREIIPVRHWAMLRIHGIWQWKGKRERKP